MDQVTKSERMLKARSIGQTCRNIGTGQILGVVSRGDFKGVELGRHEDERDLWEHMR
jgi:hypothetical protein